MWKGRQAEGCTGGVIDDGIAGSMPDVERMTG